MSNKNQRRLIAAATVIIALVVLVTVINMARTPRDTPPKGVAVAPVVADPTPSPDLNLEGTWTSKTEGADFVATIKNNTISVVWNMDALNKGLYWSGDFPSKIISGAQSTGIISNASPQDLAKLETSLAGSNGQHKEFIHQGDVLAFEFTIQDRSMTIELVQK